MLVFRFLFLMVLEFESGCPGFQGPFFMILGGLGTNFHVDLGIPGTSTCYLACWVASLWRPGGPCGDPGTLGAQERTLGGPGVDFC